MSNRNLHKAKAKANDEFYTLIGDIEKELLHYKDYLSGKSVFCNCDDPKESNFWKYFTLNFKHLGLRKVVSTHYHTAETTYKLVAELDKNGELVTTKTELQQNGDFRSPECMELLAECDIVVTNPPFSLFREFIATLVGGGKDFLVIGSMNAITYKEISPLIKDDKLWLGVTAPSQFLQPDGTIKKFGNICWFSNVPNPKRNKRIICYKEYQGNETDYPKYDNYNGIEVSKVANLPKDYDGVMGVPISYLTKHNPEQFEIIKFRKGDDGKDLRYPVNGSMKEPYNRILIQRIKDTDND